MQNLNEMMFPQDCVSSRLLLTQQIVSPPLHRTSSPGRLGTRRRTCFCLSVCDVPSTQQKVTLTSFTVLLRVGPPTADSCELCAPAPRWAPVCSSLAVFRNTWELVSLRGPSPGDSLWGPGPGVDRLNLAAPVGTTALWKHLAGPS